MTNDEMSVLMIAAEGQHMLAIGRWEPTIKSLTERGLLNCQVIAGGPQYTITDAGRKAMEAADDANLGAMIEAGSQVGAAQKTARDLAEDVAQKLVECGKVSAQFTGDSVESAVRKWCEVALRRALDIANG